MTLLILEMDVPSSDVLNKNDFLSVLWLLLFIEFHIYVFSAMQD